MLEALARRRKLAAALLAGALAVAVVVALLEPTRYRAEATVVVGTTPRQPTPQDVSGMKTLSTLALSDIVLRAAVKDLKLDVSPQDLAGRVRVRTPEGTSLLVISADAGSRSDAEKLAQEIGLVFTQLATERFPKLKATLFGSAHALPGRVSPRWGRALIVGALVGILLALLVPAALERAGPGGLRLRARELWARRPPVDRPRLPKRTPASRRERTPVAEPEPAPLPVREREPQPEPQPEPEPAPPPAPPAEEPEPLLQPRPGEWNVRALARLVERRAAETPERAEEWRAYLPALTAQADSAGMLPRRLDPLVREVFDGLLDSA